MSSRERHMVMLTVRELAERLRISRASAYLLCRQAGFPAVRIGGQIRVPVVELENWLAQRVGQTKPAA